MSNIEEITAYRTTDGQLFTNSKEAAEHQECLIGEALDDLFANDPRGNITRSDRFNVLMATMKDADLVKKVRALALAVGII